MRNRSLQYALLGAVVLSTAAFTFGGWAVVTVDDFPDYVVAGKPTPLSFAVRQHGVSLLNGLSPSVKISSGDSDVTVAANAGGASGHYSALVTMPRAGYWTVTINSGFMATRSVLPSIRAIAANAPAPRALADADRGHRLFFAKGCVTCHVRGTEGTDGIKSAPDLTGKRYEPGYVSQFLADPESSPLSKPIIAGGMRMPRLELKEREIASLVAFLNQEGTVSRQSTGGK